jgi:thiol:disulfide interchange protein
MASPCSTPILASVLLVVSQEESRWVGMGWMSLFGLGRTLVFLALGFGFVGLKGLPKSGHWMKHIHQFSTLLMIGAGAYFIGIGSGWWS